MEEIELSSDTSSLSVRRSVVPGGTPRFWQITQLTLSQPGGQIMPTYLLMAPPNFQTFRRPCRSTTTTNKDQIGSVRNTRCSECLQIYSL